MCNDDIIISCSNYYGGYRHMCYGHVLLSFWLFFKLPFINYFIPLYFLICSKGFKPACIKNCIWEAELNLYIA
jgi:hypothetical protein